MFHIMVTNWIFTGQPLPLTSSRPGQLSPPFRTSASDCKVGLVMLPAMAAEGIDDERV